MTEPNPFTDRDPATQALAEGLRAVFTSEQMEQMQQGIIQYHDVLDPEEPWGRLVDALFAAAYPRTAEEEGRG